MADATEASLIKEIKEAQRKARFPPGGPNGTIPPIEMKDTDTGEVIFLLNDPNWLQKYRDHMARRNTTKLAARPETRISMIIGNPPFGSKT